MELNENDDIDIDIDDNQSEIYYLWKNIDDKLKQIYNEHKKNSHLEISFNTKVISFLENTSKKIRFVKYLSYDKKSEKLLLKPLKELEKSCATIYELIKKLEDSVSHETMLAAINTANELVNTIYIDSFALLDSVFVDIFKKNLEFEKKSDRFIENEKFLTDRVERLDEKIDEGFAKQKELENDIHKKFTDTEDYLNQQGLSASFAKRAEKLKWGLITWLVLLIFLAGYVADLTLKYIQKLPPIDTLNFDQINIYIRGSLLHIPIVIVLFWLIWFFSKNYFYYQKLYDDYNFKNDLSKAYYGYKKETLNVENSKELQSDLLRGVLSNISKNPVDGVVCNNNSPYTEILSMFNKLLEKYKSK